MQDAVAKVRVMKERRGSIAELFGKGVGNASWNMNGGLMMPTRCGMKMWFGLVFSTRLDQTFYALPVR